MKIIHKVEFVSLFYSIPIVNLQFIKGKAWRNSRAHSQCNEIQQTTRKITYRASFVYLCHVYLKHADRYICKSLILLSFCCLPGNTARLTQANRYQTSDPQTCNEPAWVYWWTRFLRKNFLYEKKEAQLTERKFKNNNNNNNKYKKPDLPNGKKKTENHIEVSISHLSRSLIITYWNYFIDRRALNVSGITIPESFSRHLNFKDDLIQRSRVGIHLYLCLSFASSCQRI